MEVGGSVSWLAKALQDIRFLVWPACEAKQACWQSLEVDRVWHVHCAFSHTTRFQQDTVLDFERICSQAGLATLGGGDASAAQARQRLRQEGAQT